MYTYNDLMMTMSVHIYGLVDFDEECYVLSAFEL